MRHNLKQYQQGDVWIESAVIPARAVRLETKDRAVFAAGKGDHLHRAALAGAVELYELDGSRYARVLRETRLEHVTPDGRPGEHLPVSLPPGDYQFGQVFEYDYLSEMARAVVD